MDCRVLGTVRVMRSLSTCTVSEMGGSRFSAAIRICFHVRNMTFTACSSPVCIGGCGSVYVYIQRTHSVVSCRLQSSTRTALESMPATCNDVFCP
jgi:hypothetical protein